MRLDTRVGLALAVALCLQLWPWTQMTRHAEALQAAGAAMVLVLAAGWLGRRVLRLPTIGVALLQVVAAAVSLVGAIWWAHGARHVLRLPALLGEGISFIQSSSAPMFPNPGATVAIVIGAALVALAADAIAVGGERPGLAVIPLVALHLVVAVALSTPTLFSEFVALAVGIGLVLVAAAPWGHGERPAARAAALLTAVAMTAGAVGVTWVAAQFVPTFEPRTNSEPLQMSDPSLDLKRNLIQGSDEVIIRYTTDSPGGAYLKLATLPSLSTAGFALSDVRVATGRIPSPPGSPRGVGRTTNVEVGDFSSEWLPVPYAPTAFDAPGDWGFALDTLDVMAMAGPGRGRATEGISYEVRSLDVRPDAEAIARAEADGGPGRELTTSLPVELPSRIRELAREVTGAAPTAGAKAQALEAYLRSDAFTYSIAPTTGNGDGLATIDDFLFGSRTGYCEQFAGAMAIMAREVGIPTRMAVGFVPGTEEEGVWGVTERDLHTWPELWLDGLGWVAFEPTPSRGDSGAGPATPQEPTGTAAPTAGPTAEATPSAEPSEPTPTASPVPTPVDPGSPAVPGAVPWVLFGLLAAAGVAAAVFVPRWLRARRRTRRLADTGDARADTLSAWEEVCEVVADLELSWPGGSPRFAAERLVGSLGGDAGAAEALRSLAAASERALFDRSENFDLPGRWGAEVDAITAALSAQARERAGKRKSARPRRVAR